LWAATDKGGISRIKDGHITTLATGNGLPCDMIHWSIEDTDRSLWLYTACGLVRITRAELEAWIADSHHRVATSVVNAVDGVRLRAVSPSSYSPTVARSSDGKLWFVTGDNVQIIDPHHLSPNKLAPPVHIEKVVADDKTHWENLPSAAVSKLILPPQTHNLQIFYTALSLVAPEKLHFKYKLEGQDDGWREVVNDRDVQYSNLPPRHYRFRVIASNDSGVWNEAGDSLDFDVSPAWYQTYGFRAASVAALLLLLWGLYQLRVHEIHEQEKKFREAVENMPALAFVSDPAGNRAFVNRAYLEYTGMSADQALGSGWEKAIYPDDLKRVRERWRTAQAAGELMAYEVRVRRGSDGVYRWFQTRAQPVYNKRRQIVKWCAVATDTEDRKRAEQLQADLAHVSRVSTMGELAVTISHELNQPIAAAIINADLAARSLERDPPDLTQALQRTKTILEMGSLASQIIGRLRSLYKKEPPKHEPLSVNEVISEMLELLRGQATRYAVSLRADFASDVPKAIADRVQVQQVLMNLLLNGIEAMSDTGGVLTVESEVREDAEIEISVIDTGPGFPDGKADQIFDAFFTTKPQGSGMGLAISKSIVESHGGRIWANLQPGRGAAFHFTLPLAPSEADTPDRAM
jgi:PAS domain S-box-containing protein